MEGPQKEKLKLKRRRQLGDGRASDRGNIRHRLQLRVEETNAQLMRNLFVLLRKLVDSTSSCVILETLKRVQLMRN
jgi:hypothetical protein